MSHFEHRSRDELLGLLGRYSPTTAEWERREILALAEDVREVILRRLDVLDRYLAGSSRTTADADAAAEALGIPRSNLYRMLKRYQQAGALLGLAPHARIKRPARRAGEGYDFSSEITRLLRENPKAKLGFFVDRLDEISTGMDGARPPSRISIQRHIAEFRSHTAAPTRRSAAIADPVFGRDLLIDACLLGVTPDEESFGPRLGVAFVVDLDTRLVIGAGLGRAANLQLALRGALADTDAFWDAPLIGSFPTRKLPERVEWILPPRAEVAAAGFSARTRDWGIDGAVDVSPGREHGGRLIDVLGPEFGRYPLVPFVGDPDHAELPTKVAEPKVATAGDLGSVQAAPIVTEPIVTIAGVLRRSIEEWNMEIVRRRERARLVLRGPTWNQRLDAWSSSKRASDLDAGELFILLSGRGAPASAAANSVRTIWRRWQERSGGRDQI